MRLLAVSHSAVVEVNCRLYTELAARTGWEIEVMAPARWPSEYGGAGHRPGPARGFTMQPVPVWLPGRIPLHLYRSGLARRLEQFRPDLVFLDEEPYSAAAAQVALLCAARRVPLALYTKQNLRKRYPPPFRWTEQWIYRRAASILALSAEVRGVLRAKGYRGPCRLLDHAVDLELFTPGSGAELRARFGLEAPVIGYLGRLTAAKGVDLLLDALAQLREEPWTALLVGAGPCESELRARAAQAGLAGRVVLAGAAPHAEAPRYLRAMDVAVVPSRTTPGWKEQFGRVIIEALACGVPVIGSDSGHVPHLLRETGGGWVVPEGDAAALAGQIREALRDPVGRAERAAAGGAAVRRRYTYAAVADALADALLDALRGRGMADGAGAGSAAGRRTETQISPWHS